MTEFQTQLNSTNQLATSIQDARRAKNMTQTELSTITGDSPSLDQSARTRPYRESRVYQAS